MWFQLKDSAVDAAAAIIEVAARQAELQQI
jgi:hypothetical protein